MEFNSLFTKVNSKNLAYTLIIISIIVMLILAFYFDGTGDDGDSVYHYLFSKTAFKMPIHFFDHWAKPLFVLLSAPFAHFGFTSIKIFNVLCLSISLTMTYKISVELKIPNAWLTILIIICSPYIIVMTLSGLTEPLFSAFLSYGLFLLVKNRYLYGIIFLSFLPFIRSEGLIILSMLFVYLIFIRKWKLIPFLMCGHIIYGFLGLIFYDSPMWVFKNIPYAHLSSPYGKGDWFHFYVNFPIIVGYGLFIFWNIGIGVGFYKLIMNFKNNNKYPFPKEDLFLVYGIFIAFFLGHSAFWALGIFNSLGVMRVLIGVMPLIAIICLFGFNFILDLIGDFKSKFKTPTIVFFSIFSLFFLFNSLSKELFELNPYQKIQKRIANTYGKEWASQKPLPILYYNTPYLGMLLQDDFNYFDSNKRRGADQLYNGSLLPTNMYYIWEPCYAIFEGGGPASKAFGDKRLKHIKTESDGGSIVFQIFKKDTSHLKLKGQLYSFEKDKNWNPKWKVNSNDSIRIVTLNKNNPYSPQYNEFLELLSENNTNKVLKITFNAFSYGIPQTEWESARLIISVQKNGKDIKWKGLPIQQRMIKDNQWENIEFNEALPIPLSSDEKLIIYIWNENPTKVLIKDFKIELFE